MEWLHARRHHYCLDARYQTVRGSGLIETSRESKDRFSPHWWQRWDRNFLGAKINNYRPTSLPVSAFLANRYGERGLEC